MSSNNGSAMAHSIGNSSSRSTSPHSDRLAPELARQRSHSPSGSASRQRTISHHSQLGQDGVLTASVGEEEQQQPARPIHTQPPAPKAMTIPGIHASHRGEVMSMGYAPPPPPASEQKKGPAIQSVYRLWKNPSQPQTQTGFAGLDQDEGAPTEDSSASVTPTPVAAAASVRPTPPPLPPRTISTQVSTQVQLTSEPPRHPPDLDRTSPPATAALQNIVSKDRSRRASGEGLPSLSGSPGRSTYQDNQSTSTSTVPPTDVPTNDVGQVPSKPKPPALPPRRTPAAASVPP